LQAEKYHPVSRLLGDSLFRHEILGVPVRPIRDCPADALLVLAERGRSAAKCDRQIVKNFALQEARKL